MDTAPTRVLLLSGGMDSAAIAHWLRPEITLFINYGQRPAAAEARAAEAVAAELSLAHATVDIDLRHVGGGLLADDETYQNWPSPEWWPYRNQFLVTIAAAWAIRTVPGVTTSSTLELIAGTVAHDGGRHADGTQTFYDRMNSLLNSQEGNVTVTTPAIAMSTEQLIQFTQVEDAVLGWTHSCHTADIPCSDCPGCHKRYQVLDELNRLP